MVAGLREERPARTGRRARPSTRRTGATRNCLFLATTEDALLQAAGLLLLWGRGWVEPITAPAQPRHLVAQQLSR
ncbi:hypothetical protein [Nocardia sp. NPDC002869]|uniref:hypothetical protein n=1 Tax=Nocardia sp. NPDC002869 TaxID=3161032 RepID=UPI00398D4003